jgi:hypothetical protein
MVGYPIAVRVPVASSAASEVTWRSVRSDVVTRVPWGLPENIAADIRLVGPWRSLSGPCNGPLRTSTCIVTRQPSAQITLRPTSAALADIRSQRTTPSACGGALPASSALRTEPASVPVSFRPPGCSPTTDVARFGSCGPAALEGGKPSVTDSAVPVPTADRGDISRALGTLRPADQPPRPLLRCRTAFDLMLPSGAAEKVIVTLDD